MNKKYTDYNRLGTGPDRITNIAYTVLAICCGVFLWVVTFIFIIASANEVNDPVILVFESYEALILDVIAFCIGTWCMGLGILRVVYYCSTVSVCDDGVLIKYPILPEKLLPWNKFQMVCICICDPDAFILRTNTFVCFVKYEEKTDSTGMWKIKNPLHFSRIVRIQYTQELVCYLETECGVKVMDLRLSFVDRFD